MKYIKTKSTNNFLPANHGLRIAAGTALILLVPLVAMRISDDVSWDLTDFAFMGTLIFATGLMLNLVITKVRNNNYRLALGAAVILAFIYIWAELAVGIFTNLGS
jgi:peptidoglycan/LPS O-acetylase OafA/YrhL